MEREHSKKVVERSCEDIKYEKQIVITLAATNKNEDDKSNLWRNN